MKQPYNQREFPVEIAEECRRPYDDGLDDRFWCIRYDMGQKQCLMEVPLTNAQPNRGDNQPLGPITVLSIASRIPKESIFRGRDVYERAILQANRALWVPPTQHMIESLRDARFTRRLLSVSDAFLLKGGAHLFNKDVEFTDSLYGRSDQLQEQCERFMFAEWQKMTHDLPIGIFTCRGLQVVISELTQKAPTAMLAAHAPQNGYLPTTHRVRLTTTSLPSGVQQSLLSQLAELHHVNSHHQQGFYATEEVVNLLQKHSWHVVLVADIAKESTPALEMIVRIINDKIVGIAIQGHPERSPKPHEDLLFKWIQQVAQEHIEQR